MMPGYLTSLDDMLSLLLKQPKATLITSGICTLICSCLLDMQSCPADMNEAVKFHGDP